MKNFNPIFHPVFVVVYMLIAGFFGIYLFFNGFIKMNNAVHTAIDINKFNAININVNKVDFQRGFLIFNDNDNQWYEYISCFNSSIDSIQGDVYDKKIKVFKDIEPPYILYKAEDEDVLHINKDGHEMYIKLNCNY